MMETSLSEADLKIMTLAKENGWTVFLSNGSVVICKTLNHQNATSGISEYTIEVEIPCDGTCGSDCSHPPNSSDQKQWCE